MEFNSLYFAVFLLCVVCAYYITPDRLRWVVLLIASYFFYLNWSPKYFPLLLASTLINYWLGLQIGNESKPPQRKLFLALAIILNLGLLIIFKYLNFISDGIEAILTTWNISYSTTKFDWLAPIGISFYTLQLIGYFIDIYKGTQKPEKHLGKFALFVSFFPLLVSGPIERAKKLLPQFANRGNFNYDNAKVGLQRITWGIFKKVVIADRLAVYVNQVFNPAQEIQGLPAILGVILFAFQLYCDFSGYSDIVIGTAKILGIELTENFRSPLFANSIQNFWNSWHISLSTWLRDYVFFALRRNLLKQKKMPGWLIQSIPPMITMLISGIWHGANWTFVLWGGLHGLYLIVETTFKPTVDRLVENLQTGTILRNLYSSFQTILTFGLTCFGWIFFRSDSVAQALQLIDNLTVLNLSHYTSAIATQNWSKLIEPFVFSDGLSLFNLALAMGAIVFLLLVENLHNKKDLLKQLNLSPLPVRWGVYLLAVFIVVFLSADASTKNFIYFKF